VDVKQVGQELGVLYVLEGSVRKAANRMRITGQLIDAISGAHLWADHFDGSLEDVFELQDNVALSVAGVIEPTLQAAEIHRSAQRATNDLTAYDLYLRALADAKSWEKERLSHALELCGQALDRDPRYGPALALATMCHLSLYGNGWTNDLEGARRKSLDYARTALQVAGNDPHVLANAAFALGYFGEDITAALALVDTQRLAQVMGWAT
jgi:adenylate cyclase